MSDIVKGAIILALGLIVSSYLYSGRYTMLLDAGSQAVWRLDRYTGTLSVCGIPDNKQVAGCAPMIEGRKAAVENVESVTE